MALVAVVFKHLLLLVLVIVLMLASVSFGLCFEKAFPDLHELHEVASLVSLDCCSLEGVET